MERIGWDKMVFLKQNITQFDQIEEFFEQLKTIVTGALTFSRTEPRYDGIWRNFMHENDDMKRAVKTVFPELSNDFSGGLVDHTITTGQLSQRYDWDFIYSTVNLFQQYGFFCPNRDI